MFQIGDKIAHPMHGAGIVDDIVERSIDGKAQTYYSLKLPVGDMLVMVPIRTSHTIGVRPIVCAREAERVMDSLGQDPEAIDTNWSRRYRDNLDRIKSGDLDQVATVIRSLSRRDSQRGLSTGERKMLHSAKQILISEVVLSEGREYDEVEDQMDRALKV